MDFFFTLIGVPPLPTEMPMLRIFSFRLNIFKQLHSNDLNILKWMCKTLFQVLKNSPTEPGKTAFLLVGSLSLWRE